MLERLCSKSFKLSLNRELSDVQAGFGKGRGTRGWIANIHCIMEKARGLQKKPNYALLTMLKSLCGAQQTVENS